MAQYRVFAWSARSRVIYFSEVWSDKEAACAFAREFAKGRMDRLSHVSVQDHNNNTVASYVALVERIKAIV
jgi:hypothetical protein